MNNIVSIDTETTGLMAWQGDAPFAVSACWPNGDQQYWDWPVDPYTREVQYKVNQKALRELKSILGDKGLAKVFWHAKFDVRMFEKGPGLEVLGTIHEGMFAAHVCNTLEFNYQLKYLSERYARVPKTDEKSLQQATAAARRIGKKRGWWLGIELRQDYWMPKAIDPTSGVCEEYCCMDTERTMLLWLMYEKLMDKYGTRAAYDLEMELWPIVWEMESRGVKVRHQTIMESIEKHGKVRDKHLKEVFRLAGGEFNLNSSKQLIKIIYEDLKLPVKKYTKKAGTPSVKASTLEDYRDEPFIDSLLKYRVTDKAIHSFFEQYIHFMVPDLINPGEYAVHASFNQVGPKTGRFSCRNPALQTVSNSTSPRGVEIIEVRNCFGPRPGYVWLHYDYSQVEVRIFASLANEDTMLQAILDGRDLHTECANKAWGGKENPQAVNTAINALELRMDGIRTPEVTEWWERSRDGEESYGDIASEWLDIFDYKIVEAESSLGKRASRGHAKMVLFAKLYGGGPNAIMDLLKVDKAEAQRFFADYDKAFPKINKYIKDLSYKARKDRFIINPFGRRLTIDPEYSYRAVNYMIQGSSADMMKQSMRRLHRYFKDEELDFHLVMTIHDELVIEAREDQVTDAILQKIKWIMEDHGGVFTVPLPVNLDIVRVSWDKKETVEL